MLVVVAVVTVQAIQLDGTVVVRQILFMQHLVAHTELEVQYLPNSVSPDPWKQEATLVKRSNN